MFSPADTTIFNKASEAIHLLAVHAAPAAKHVYGLAVKQVYVEAVGSTLTLAFAWAVVGTIFGLSFHRSMKDNNQYGTTSSEVTAIVSGILGGILFIVTLFSVGDIAAALLNPEWGAIQKLAGLIK